MTDPPQDDGAPEELPAGGEDRTRDIRLPSLPGRPPPVLPREWASAQRSSVSPEPVSPEPVSEEPQSEAARELSAHAFRTTGRPLAEQPTDELVPPGGRPRERTIAFASPDMAGGRPAPSVGRTPRRPRRWPWVVLGLLPVLVIVGAGITLLVLLRGS
jgi:hypothetical protein